MTRILGISAYYHDSAAALLVDGELVAAAQEERFTRTKHDASFPLNAILYCLDGLTLSDIDHIVFYEKPLLKFERILETYLAFAPNGFKQFRLAMPVWVKDKLFLKQRLKQAFASLDEQRDWRQRPLLFAEHHKSHASSAFYGSPFESSAVLCVDGVGEWATTSAWFGTTTNLGPLWQINFPHSLGLLYSAFTYFCGFKVNSGEYKLMGLAPYGKPRYTSLIKDHLIDIKADGSFRLDLDYFNYCTGTTMVSDRFCDLFSTRPRDPDEEVREIDMDLAASIQSVTSEVMLRLARSIKLDTGASNLCLSGGVALNCVANSVIKRAGVFDSVWVQPASGDAGGAVGAAWCAWHEHLHHTKRALQSQPDHMSGCLLGPAFDNAGIRQRLSQAGAIMTEIPDQEIYATTARLIADGKVVGWFQGPMEFGPRALGARSILADPRSSDMQKKMNLQIKGRESFRPFAPAVLLEDVGQYFDTATPSPYMTFVEPVLESLRLAPANERSGLERVNEVRSTLPAITHIDYSARLQTVTIEGNPWLYRLLRAFKTETGCSVLINTSFNVRGEPIVCSPEDAFRCFMNTDMDYLVIGNFVLAKDQQTAVVEGTRFDAD